MQKALEQIKKPVILSTDPETLMWNSLTYAVLLCAVVMVFRFGL